MSRQLVRRVSWATSLLGFAGRLLCTDALRQVAMLSSVDADVLHWEDLQRRGANTSGMVSSWLWTVPLQLPPLIYTYDAKEDTVISKEIQVRGTWEAVPVNKACRLAHEAGVGNLLDVGANIGAWTLAFAQCLGHQRRVYSVEAVPSNVEHLVASVLSDRFSNVVLVPNAVGSPWDPPTITMEVKRLTKGGSLRENNESNDESSGSRANRSQVKLTTLDAIASREPGMKKLLYMKMDIEGSEGRALQGARRLLSEAPPCYVYVELNPTLLKRLGTPFAEVVALLHDAGYDTSAVPPEESSTYLVEQRNMGACLQRLRGPA